MSGILLDTFGLRPVRSESSISGSAIPPGATLYHYKPEKQENKIYSKLENKLVVDRDYRGSRRLADSLERILYLTPGLDSEVIAASLYYIGVSYSLNDMEVKSFPYFNKAISLLGNDTANQLLGKIYYNLGYAYNRIDDHVRSASYFLKAISYTRIKEGDNRRELVTDYISLAISSINTRNYKKALEYSNEALSIANSDSVLVDAESMANIYQDKGVAFTNMSDYHQGKYNLDQAFQILNSIPHKMNDSYINLLSNLAATYFYLGDIEKGFEIYKKDLKEIINYGSFTAFNFIKNYCIILAEKGNRVRGEEIFAVAVEKVKSNYPESPNKYYDALSGYAGYLLQYDIDRKKALLLYGKCYEYVKGHPWSENLNNDIALGYSLALLDNGKPLVALDSVCAILYRGTTRSVPADHLLNPLLSELKPDKKTLDILHAKFRILNKISSSGKDTSIIFHKARTADLVIDLLETIRLSIGEEQSRLILGGKYRNSYIDAISSYKLCYDITGRKEFIEKAFGLSERSKAASLLASIREVNAMKAAIPEEKMIEEIELQKEISFYQSRYEEEKYSNKPDSGKLRFWESSLLTSIDKRSALIRLFEEKYPEYSTLKSNTLVVKPDDVKKITGRSKDYLSYIVGDKTLYIFLVNKKETLLSEMTIDSSFTILVNNYRRLLSDPDLEGNARQEFRLFQEYGYRLFSLLIKPVSDHFISDKLIISTDNMLSYFPFEILVTEGKVEDDLYYKRLPYLMNKFRISYAYSATLLSESGRTSASFRNTSVSFAPSYSKPIYIDSLLVNRQQSGGILPDLRFAREEAGYISELTSGKLYTDTAATKLKYMEEAGKYDIIHLAMHTVLNSRNPVNSGMIFAATAKPENRYLQPYEVYSVLLNAKMVVLSSCFTGSGTLYAGEGVLSLARGFIYSGSRSVVMSLWEINDRSGTEIMKIFYSRLKSGMSKSMALREARMNYLKEADMLRAHPYFWSTLVIYGDDSAVYRPSYLIPVIIAIPLIILALAFIYLRKR